MKSVNLRNVLLLGHGGTGKTSIAEAVLYTSKAIDRMGKIPDGNTTLDYDPEEIKRQYSISLAIAPVDWKDTTINLMDAPGALNFEGEMLEGAKVADAAVIVIAGRIAVSAERGWDLVNERHLPRAILLNKMNDESIDFNKLYGEIREEFGKFCVATQLPIKENRKLVGYVDTLHMRAKRYGANGVVSDMEIPADLMAQATELHEALIEVVAESDDELMEKYFNGEQFTEDEIVEGFRTAVKSCIVCPVMISAATDNYGMAELANFMAGCFPSPVECEKVFALNEAGEDIILPIAEEGPAVAFVFKTIVDPYVGRMSMFKVMTGTIKNGDVLHNVEKDCDERISQLVVLRGKKQILVNQLVAGDIGAVAKLQNTSTNNTLCSKDITVTIPPIEFPEPQHAQAIIAKNKGDDDKVAQGLLKIKGEDKTFNFRQNKETGQMIVTAVGEKHLDIIVTKLKTRYNVDVVLSNPKVPYRETIRKKVIQEATHKKQSGGSGQYGKVVIEFEPGTQDELEFAERVVGGSVPKQFFPSVEKGLQESVKSGVLAGYPVVKLKATLVDGKYHPVDSKEVAFVSAASMAYRTGLPNAAPVLLEPIQSVKIIVPDKYMGDVIGDLNKRRGRVLGMTPVEYGKQEIEAEVPFAEMFTYATDLRSIAHARAKFTSEFVRYEDVPSHIAQAIIEAAKAEE